MGDPTVKVEYGRMIDCRTEGCDPPHADAERIYPWPDDWERPEECPQLNRSKPHAVRWVRRTVTTTVWEPTDDG